MIMRMHGTYDVSRERIAMQIMHKAYIISPMPSVVHSEASESHKINYACSLRRRSAFLTPPLKSQTATPI